MKKAIAVLLASTAVAVAASPTNACSVPNSTTDSIRKIVEAHGGWPVTDAQCAILRSHNLNLSVTGDATVLNGVNVGWATAALLDPKSLIVSANYGSSTSVNTNVASQNTADDQAYTAIKSAIEKLNWDQAAREVEASRRRVR